MPASTAIVRMERFNVERATRRVLEATLVVDGSCSASTARAHARTRTRAPAACHRRCGGRVMRHLTQEGWLPVMRRTWLSCVRRHRTLSLLFVFPLEKDLEMWRPAL